MIEKTKPGLLWRLFIVAVAPIVVVSGYLVCSQLFDHVSGAHETLPAFIIGISLGGWFVMTLPWRWSIRIVFLIVYIPLAWALLVSYSLWFIAVVFHAMISGG